MVVKVTGGSAREPVVVKMNRGKTIQREIEKRLEVLTHNGAILVDAPPGMGKTHTVGHVIAPWAKRKGMAIAFICPRIAPNTQAKQEFIKALGEDHLLNQLTDEGIQEREEIGNVSVMTAQRLYGLMQTDPESLKRFQMLVFDEVHLLLEDALFSSSTGYVLEHLRNYFGGAIRIYLSATPEAILPMIAKIEAPYTVQVLKFPTSYGYVRPYFFQDTEELVKKINSDKSSTKWLVYVPTIAEGKALKKRLACSVRLLNRLEREEDREGWNTVLRNEKFGEKVCICTAVVDVGVNFKDPLLQNIVVFSLNPNTILQFLGRKRRTPAEKINLFVKCPSQQELCSVMRLNQELIEAVNLYRKDYPRFAKQHILQSTDRDLRGWLRVTREGEFELNPLVSKKLLVQKDHLERLLKRAKENNGDCCFDKFVVHLLRIPLPDRAECWLDPRYSGTAKVEFEQFLSASVGKPMNDVEFAHFCEQFRDLCVAAFGTNGGRDRLDRDWGLQKITNKLGELDNGYILRMDRTTKMVRLELIGTQLDTE